MTWWWVDYPRVVHSHERSGAASCLERPGRRVGAGARGGPWARESGPRRTATSKRASSSSASLGLHHPYRSSSTSGAKSSTTDHFHWKRFRFATGASPNAPPRCIGRQTGRYSQKSRSPLRRHPRITPPQLPARRARTCGPSPPSLAPPHCPPPPASPAHRANRPAECRRTPGLPYPQYGHFLNVERGASHAATYRSLACERACSSRSRSSADMGRSELVASRRLA
jgi:hypothetical protein